MKLIIAGTRTFNDYEYLKQLVDDAIKLFVGEDIIDNLEIVSGTADGADKLGERYAKEKGYKVKRFPANWNKHGKAAGPIRNREMAGYTDYAVVFWDGHSKGAKDMRENMYRLDKKVLTVMYEQDPRYKENRV